MMISQRLATSQLHTLGYSTSGLRPRSWPLPQAWRMLLAGRGQYWWPHTDPVIPSARVSLTQSTSDFSGKGDRVWKLSVSPELPAGWEGCVSSHHHSPSALLRARERALSLPLSDSTSDLLWDRCSRDREPGKDFSSGLACRALLYDHPASLREEASSCGVKFMMFALSMK